MTNWGATVEEAQAFMPGDEVVGEAKYRTTHAVTIEAVPERVWVWLVQIGQGRGGMYSYDWLENLFGLRMHSADTVVPELQGLGIGDTVRLVPEGTEPDLSFSIISLEPPSLLVLGPEGSREEALTQGLPYPCWTFLISSEGVDRSRLLVRFQCDFAPGAGSWLMYKAALPPIHFLMERKMLLTLKERAERSVSVGAA